MEFMDAIQNFTIANMNLQFFMRNKENLGSCYSYSLDAHLNNSETSYVSGANVLFQKLSKSNKPEMSFVLDNNIKKKFENCTRYISNKEQSLMKDSMNHWNQMSTGYSEFFASPRGYSYVSNSVASYLIGGFVGSKSQMNNEKHKLSYDLGEVIFKILNNYKYDKSLDKLKEEKKCDVNKIGKKSRFFFKDQNELFECEYNMAIWNSLVEKSKDPVKVLNDNSYNKMMEVKKENVKNLSSVGVEAMHFAKQIEKMESSGDGKEHLEAGNVIVHADPSIDKNDCKEKPLNINIVRDSSNINILLKPEIEDVPSEMEKHKNVMNLPNISSPGHAPVLESRRRQCSECSAESTDSESFIVFDDKCCDSSYEVINYNCQESDCEDSDCYCEEDDGGFEEVFENTCWTRSKDEFDFSYEEKEVKEANKKWSDFYKRVCFDDDDGDDSRKKVHFREETKVHRIIAWDYAYRAARHGPWEQMARDRDRFKEKIERLSSIISPVLEDSHRKKVYNKLYE